MGIRNINYGLDFVASVEIDEERAIESIKDCVLHSDNSSSLLNSYNGDFIEAYLHELAVIILPMTKEYELEGIIGQFEDMDGFFPIDGSSGVKLLAVDEWEWKNQIEISNP